MSKDQIYTYKAFVKNHCVRDQEQVKICLLAKLKAEIITLTSKISNLKRLLLSDGKLTDFNSELFTRLIQILEPEAEELLLSSKIGRSYLGEFGPVFIKQLTFCGFCLKIGIEVVYSKIPNDDAKLIFSSILNYYLAGNIININNLEQIRQRIQEKEMLIDGSVKREITIVDDFFKMEFPEIESLDKEKLESIKNYLDDDRVSNLIDEISSEPQIIAGETEEKITIGKLPILNFDSDNLTKEELNLFTKYKKKCVECTKTITECDKELQKVRKLVEDRIKKLKLIWETQIEFRPCIAKFILERNI